MLSLVFAPAERCLVALGARGKGRSSGGGDFGGGIAASCSGEGATRRGLVLSLRSAVLERLKKSLIGLLRNVSLEDQRLRLCLLHTSSVAHYQGAPSEEPSTNSPFPL